MVAALFTFLTFLAAYALFTILPMEFNAAKKSRNDVLGHYAVDAGVKEAVAWLESRPRTAVFGPDQLSEFNNTFASPKELSRDWSYRAHIDTEPGNTGHFWVTSTAYFRTRKIREAKAQFVWRGFESFALFIDHWRMANDPTVDLFFNLGENVIQGPFHTNDHFVLNVPSGAYDGGNAFVSGPYAAMTHAGLGPDPSGDLEGFPGDGNSYLGGSGPNSSPNAVPYNEDGAIEERYQRIVEGGRGSLSQSPSFTFPNTAVDKFGMPLRSKARGGGAFSGILETGVHVHTDESFEVTGGVYVIGNSSIELALDSNGNQLQKISQTHLAEMYYRAEDQTVLVPAPPIPSLTHNPPSTIPEVRYRIDRPTVIVGYEPVPVEGDGMTMTIQRPIYGEGDPVEVPYIVHVPYDPSVHGDGPWTIWEASNEEGTTYVERIRVPIDESEYDPNNPDHEIDLVPAGDRLYEVVEVTEEAGYQIPAGFAVEGATGGSSVAKEHTVFLDHHEQRAVVGTGNLNGVTFVEGNVIGLQGINKGSVTQGPHGNTYSGRVVVAGPEHGYKIDVTGHLRQFYNRGDENQGMGMTLANGKLPPNAHHALGLVARDVNLKPSFQTSSAHPLNIYALIMAGHGAINAQGQPLDASGVPIETSGNRQQVFGGFGTAAELLTPAAALDRGYFHLYGGVITGNARAYFLGNKGLESNLIYDPAAASYFPNFARIQSLRTVRYSEYPVTGSTSG